METWPGTVFVTGGRDISEGRSSKIPAYRLFEALPPTRALAKRIGLVTLSQRVGALVRAVENPPRGVRIEEVPEIRKESA